MISLRSKITQAVLGFFFLHEEESFFVNELSRQLKLDSGNLSRKLLEMESLGMLKSESKGNLKYFMLNKNFGLLNEYRQIVLKTIGLENELKTALSSIPAIKNVYLFGSYASNKLDVTSDIDVLIVGDHSPIEAQKACLPLQKKFRREINVVNITPKEFGKKQHTQAFLKNILKKPKVVVV